MLNLTENRLRMDFHGMNPRLIWANERVVEPQFQKSGGTGSDIETVAWLILEGSATVTYQNARVRVKPGQWIFLRAESWQQHFARDSRLISLRFHLRLRGGKALFAPREDIIVNDIDRPQLAKTARALITEFARVNTFGTLWIARERLNLVDNFRIESAFMAWLGAYVETMESVGLAPTVADNHDERVVKSLALIEGHRMRDKFSEAALARSCGLSINQLTRLFRNEMSLSPFQYYERQRLELARHALTGSKLPIKEISFELGFGSSAHFSNWFNGKEGVGPRAYRTRQTDPNS